MSPTRIISALGAFLVIGIGNARAQGVAVQLQCWQGSTESAILPRLTFDEVAKVHGCKVLVSNNTGAPLDDVHFDLDFGQAPPATLVSNPEIGNQDPGAYYNCPTQPPTGATFRPNTVLNVGANFPGFPIGTTVSGTSNPYGKRCFDYNVAPHASWVVDIPAASTETLRVEFRSGFMLVGSSFTTELRLDVTNLPGGVTVAPQTVPVDVAIPQHDLDAAQLYAPIQSPALAMAGTLYIGTAFYGFRGAHTGMVADFYLPYLRPIGGGVYQLRADGGYVAGSDELLHDAADLELNAAYAEFLDVHAARFRDAVGPLDEITAGTLALPLVKVDDDHYHIDLGHLSGNANDLGTRRVVVSWAAGYRQVAAVQGYLAGRSTVMTGRICGHTDQAPTTVCAQTDAPLYTAAQAIQNLYGQLELWDPLESTCRHASLSIL